MLDAAGRRVRRIAIAGGLLALTSGCWATTAGAVAVPQSRTFDYTGGEQTFTVPAGVGRLQVRAVGAAGGSGPVAHPNGEPAVVSGAVGVVPASTLYVEVGGDGSSFPNPAAGGWNGGGSTALAGGGGGGASDVRTEPRSVPLTSVADSRLLVAGGAGGSGAPGPVDDSSCGAPPLAGGGGAAASAGDPGDANGSEGGGGAGGAGSSTGAGAGGSGGTGTGAGAAGGDGALGVGGSSVRGMGGGGGGGLFGGGAGGDGAFDGTCGGAGGGGGGGSSLVPAGGTSGLVAAALPASVTVGWTLYEPTCMDRGAAVLDNATAELGLSCTVEPAGGAMSYNIDRLPAHGTLSAIDGQGQLTYTPDPGYTGPDTFTYDASTATASTAGAATFSLDVVASPVVQTGAATDVTTDPVTGTSSVTLTGLVNPNGLATGYHFDYGPTTAYTAMTLDVSIGAGTSDVPVAATLTGLPAGQTFHYKLVADTSAGTASGTDMIFTTPPVPIAPAVATGAATNVRTGSSTGSATLNGLVTPNGASTSYRFDYGTTTGYGASTDEIDAGSGTSGVVASADLTGLQAGTTYHYRLVATNAIGTSYGDDQTFTVPAATISTAPPDGDGVPPTLTPTPTPAPRPGRVTITTEPDPLNASRRVRVAFSAPSGDIGFQCRLDVGPWVACRSPYELVGLHSGDHRIAIRGLNAAGVAGSAVRTARFQVNVYAPGIAVRNPATIRVSRTGTVELRILCSPREGAGHGACSGAVTLHAASGSAKARARSLARGTFRAPAGRTVTIPLILSPAARRLLTRGRHGRLRVAVRIEARDLAGNRGTLTAKRVLA